MTDPITKTIDVNCAPARAFDIFVNQIAAWWPLDSHAASVAAGQAALAVTIEPRIGGDVIETMYDGSKQTWGKVLEFEAGRKFAMTWHPGHSADFATRVVVEFAALGPDRTKVTLIHSGWEIWESQAKAKRDNYDTGWDVVLGQCFLSAANT